MNKICTSLDQSKKLVELGIDVNTADMYYVNSDIDKVVIRNWKDEMHDEDDIPCWSLVALLSVIKPVNDNTYTIRGTLDGGAFISFDEVTNVMYQEKDIIDAAFEMVCWLKEKGRL